jgi:beta-galactosidase
MGKSDHHRRFARLLVSGVILPGAFCLLSSFPAQAAAPKPPRTDTSLVSGWRFNQSDPGAVAATPDFNDREWTALILPHNWGWEQAQTGQRYLRGPGWYRRMLDIRQPVPGRRYFVHFEAAGSVADVYLNGKHLGQHRGAFGAFCFEITKDLSTNSPSILAVRVSNAEEPDVAPLSGDFPVYGGLYRPVRLIETDDRCITPTDHGSPGVAWLQTRVSKSEAVLDVIVQISNGTRVKQLMTLNARVLDVQGVQIAEAMQPVTLAPNVTEPFTLRVTVPNPRLWHGRKDPYLHRAVVELRETNTVVDRVEQPLGLRSFRVDPDLGFFLNDEPYHLHGVNRHQDRPDKGWAIAEAEQDEDLALIMEIGATAVRCAHYQHSDYFYSLCDKAGLLVWAELPLVDRIGTSPRFAETSREQLLDLIRQNINHPSIFTWSLFNELRPRNPDPHRLLQDLRVVANGEDPTRPTVAATCTTELPQMNKIPDLIGWNIYPGWYPEWGPLSDFGPKLDSYRVTSRRGGYCVSEYGAGANIEHHEQNAPQPVADGQWHPEEWQATLHEEAWKQMKARPYVWGTFVWNMFDFTSYWRKEGGVKGRNDKGLVTYDRKTKKDAFYFYKANWSQQPTLYITSRRHVARTNAVTDVKVYSNATRGVELFVNGVSQGRNRDDGNAVFVWKDIKLQPGENTIEAKAEHLGQLLSDRCVWTTPKPKEP